MDSKRIGSLLAKLRKERNMTQLELSQILHVSPQAVSKWETGNGCPDVMLAQRLAEIYGVGMAQLLRGEVTPGTPEVGNMKRLKFYVCPDCGNILTAMGGELHCCGRKLEPLVPKAVDEDHGVTVETVEDEWYITFRHPMEKGHYFRFAAVVGV